MTKYLLGENDLPLNEAELHSLAEALDDSFTMNENSLEVVVEPSFVCKIEEPFWGAVVRGAAKDRTDFEDFIQSDMQSKENGVGVSERYLQRLDSEFDGNDSHWLRSNPFSFKEEKIKAFFHKMLVLSLRNTKYESIIDEKQFFAKKMIHNMKQFSRVWHEFHIVAQFQMIDYIYEETLKGNESVHIADFELHCKFYGILGRLIESYRWRFAFGHDVMRGQKVVKSASTGGKSHAKSNFERSKQICNAMNDYVQSGHTVAQAARLSHLKGLGTSIEANRKLWYRRKLGHRPPMSQ